MARIYISCTLLSFFKRHAYPILSRYVRMLKLPSLYGVTKRMPVLSKNVRISSIQWPFYWKSQLFKYERAFGRFSSTVLGRIASHYYITHNSMMVYDRHPTPTMSTLELFCVFALSNEFKLLRASISFQCIGIPLILSSGSTRVETRIG